MTAFGSRDLTDDRVPAHFAEHEAFRVWRATLRDGAGGDRYCRQPRLCTAPHVFATGTNLVVGLDERLILKIFPPMLRAQFVSERGSLVAACAGGSVSRSPRSSPRVSGDGWPYLIITRLSGVLGADAWAALPEQDKARVLAEIGETIARGAARSARRIACDRAALGCFYARADRGVPGKACAARPGDRNFSMGWTICCATRAELIPMDAPPVILTGEYIPGEFPAGASGRRAGMLAGLIDFGDVLTGGRDYDLLGPERLHGRGPGRGGCSACSRALAIRAADIDPDAEAAADGPDAAASLQRSRPGSICIEGWQRKAADNPVDLQDVDLAGLSAAQQRSRPKYLHI